MIAFLSTMVLLLQAVISVHTQLVVVPVVVTDTHGLHVPGLSQDDFRVYDNGRLQPIVAFDRGETPVTLGLIIDRSQSMRARDRALLDSVTAVLESSRPDDELFAVGFNDDARFVLPANQPFTNDAAALERALAAAPAQGRTALYDAVAEGLGHLGAGHAARHALVVVSDGGDNASHRTYADILALARRSDAVIYAIGLLGTAPADEEEQDGGLLRRICRDTGGVAYFPKTGDEIAAASVRIARDLRDQYTLGFAPGEPGGTPRFHAIRVTATGADGGRLHVRARTGYLTP